jgi:hypothetical protein
VAGLDDAHSEPEPAPAADEHVNGNNGWDEALALNGAGEEAHAHN